MSSFWILLQDEVVVVVVVVVTPDVISHTKCQ